MPQFVCAKCGRSTTQEMQKIRWLMRHGKTDMNLKGFCIGSIDEPLNNLGRQQAMETAKIFSATEEPDAIVSSPMQRARETAEIFRGSFGMDRDIQTLIDIRLRERCVGEIEGKRETPESDILLLNPHYLPEGATPLTEFEEETRELVHSCQILSFKKILVVTHSFRMLTMIKLIKGLSVEKIMDYPVPANCQIITLGIADPCGCGSHFYEKTA